MDPGGKMFWNPCIKGLLSFLSCSLTQSHAEMSPASYLFQFCPSGAIQPFQTFNPDSNSIWLLNQFPLQWHAYPLWCMGPPLGATILRVVTSGFHPKIWSDDFWPSQHLQGEARSSPQISVSILLILLLVNCQLWGHLPKPGTQDI